MTLRVLIITQGLSRIVKPLLHSKHEVVGIVESAPRRSKKQRSRYVAAKILNTTSGFLFRDPSRLQGYCLQKRIPYFLMTKKNQSDSEKFIRNLKPDVVVVFSMSQLLSRDIFEIPRHGTINVHPSFLPKYRGPNPNFWQYYFFEKEVGVTIHYVDEGEDTGDIITQGNVLLPAGIRSPEKLDIQVSEVGVRLLIAVLEEIETCSASSKKQPRVSPTPRARNVNDEEHKTLIDWEKWPIEHVWHVLRGTESWLNCIDQPHGGFLGQRWRVGSYEKQRVDSGMGEVGVVKKDRGGSYVQCKDGKIRLVVSFSFKNVIKNILRKVF